MAVEFTPESLTDLTEAIQRAAPTWDLSDQAEITLLNVSENATFRVDDADRTLVLRVHRLNYHEEEEIRSELAWIEALRQDGVVDTPEPRKGRNGQYVQTLVSATGRPMRRAVAFAFAGGKEPAPGEDLVAWFKRLGALTAQMHLHTKAWARPDTFRRKTWDFDAMFGPRPFWGDWRQGVGLDASGTALMTRALDCIKTRLDRFGRGPERFGLIHADLRLANLLVDDDKLRVIDFDDCGLSWHLYDFATAVSFFEHEPIVATLREAWVDGYRGVAPLPDADEAELPIFVAMRRFLLVAWIASHPEVPIAQELGATYTAGALDMADDLLSTYG